ncbi:MAG: hypothetical protein V4504_02270 [Patescibacteria group bacterium]
MTKVYFFILWRKAGSYHRNEVTEIVLNIIKVHRTECTLKGCNPTYNGADWEAKIMTIGLGKYFHNLLKGKERIGFVSHIVHSILKIKKIPKKKQKPIVKVMLPKTKPTMQLRMSF